MMTKSTLAALMLLVSRSIVVKAQTPLASQSFTYTDLPYKADPSDGERGPQTGYNICNSTTENQNSLCQTGIINSLDDFCLWGPPIANATIADTEEECVAWCTKPGHGTRLIPEGALTGVQFIQTPDYVQVTGNINQILIDIATDDDGGELDPHGADGRGNPIGSLIFTNAFAASAGNPNTYIQAIEWHNFMGGGQFCLKACDPSRPNAANYCQHIFDRIGCLYNAPASYEDGVFESCLGDSQDFPGVYTGSDGIVSTYTQPDESLGPITTMPYTPKIPASSSCTTGISSVLYASAPSATIALTTTTDEEALTTQRAATTRTSTSSALSGTATGAAFANASPAMAGWVVGFLGALGVLFF